MRRKPSGRGRIAGLLACILLAWLASAAAHTPAWWQVSAALDYTPNGTQPGLLHALIDSDNCANCHAGNNTSEQAFFPWDSWSGSMMANATRDPLFWAALDIANHDQAGVGDYCLRCHTPGGWYGGRVSKVGDGSSVDGSNGCLLHGDYTSGDTSDYSGESCHFCHRLLDQGPQGQPISHENANAWLDDGDCNGVGQPCRHGPYDYAQGAVSAPPHAWMTSSYYQHGLVCGTCHNVTTPDTSAGPLKTLIASDGRDTGIPFPIERTFSEWKLSAFADVIFRDAFGGTATGVPVLHRAEQCQDCHMPVSSDPGAYACVLESPGSRSNNLPVHSFAGGNTWVTTVLGGEYGGALSRTAAFAQSALAAQQLLAGAAQVDLTPGALVAPGATVAGTLDLTVRVTNLAGHKFPTGYAEGRRAWLNLQVRDADQALIAESAAYDAASGVLTEDSQARVYEVIQGIWDSASGNCRHTDGSGNAQFHFVLNNCIAKDNRIPPLGFSGGASLETAPVGQTYPVTPGNAALLVNYDDVAYHLVLPPGSRFPLSVSATLRYQTASKPYIDFLADQAQANAFPAENTLCSGAAGRPFNVGPQARSRGAYLYQLWNNAPDDTSQPGYGKSPPQQVGTTASITVEKK